MGTRPDRNLPPDDPSSARKTEYFILAGVNSSWPFYDLADRVLQSGGQPDCIFDVAYEAQSASVRNRLGGKINSGTIYLLVPIVTAQMLDYLDSGNHEDIESILARTMEVLQKTTAKDVESLEKFIHLGYEISARHRERIGRPKLARYPDLKAVSRTSGRWRGLTSTSMPCGRWCRATPTLCRSIDSSSTTPTRASCGPAS